MIGIPERPKMIGIPARSEMIGPTEMISTLILYLELQFTTLGEGKQSHCRNNKTSRIYFCPEFQFGPVHWSIGAA